MISLNLSREITRILLCFDNYSDRCIERLTNCSHQTFGRLRHKIRTLGITDWSNIHSLSDDEFKALLYPKLSNRQTDKILPDCEEEAKQLRLKSKRRKTRIMRYREYRLKYGKENTYGYARYCEILNEYLKSQHVVMKQVYLPGEIMFIDFAGTKLKFQVRGKEKYLSVFVACLGYSRKLFALATKDQTSNSWMRGIIAAFEYFGGATEVVLFDNAKANVIKPSRLAILNDNARALSQHYGNICDTSRVATPSDNPLAENSVKIFTMKVFTTANQDLQFFSESEVNRFLFEQIEEINATPFQKRPESRSLLFEQVERQALKYLPTTPFKSFHIQKSVKVPSTYLIPYKGYEYSVPYTLVGKMVTVRISNYDIEVFHNGKMVAQHMLSNKDQGFTRLPEHMKPSHLAEENKSKETFMSWAHDISPDVEEIIEKQYSLTSNVKSRAVGKRCLTLQKLCDTCGNEMFSKACHYALEREWFDPQDIELVVKAKAWESSEHHHLIEHPNVRGRDYYVGDKDE